MIIVNASAETVNLQGFTTPLTVTLITGTTHSNQVVINGTEAFIAGSSPSNATLNVTSNISGNPVISIGGVLSSDAALTVTANGAIQIALGGKVNASTLTMVTSSSGSGSGTISQQDAVTTPTLTAGTIILAATGNGSGGNNIAVGIGGSSTTGLTAFAPNGSVNISSTAPIALQGNTFGSSIFGNTAQGNFTLASSGQITSAFSVGTIANYINVAGVSQWGVAV